MKIEVKLVRDCCSIREDLVPIEGSPLYKGQAVEFKFCKHCGKHWEAHSYMDAAGSMDWEYRPMPRPWEKKAKP